MRLRSSRFIFQGLLLPFLVVGSFPAQEPSQPPQANPAPSVRQAMKWKRFDYTCEAGAKLTVYLRNQTAKVLLKDKVYLMKQVISGSGTRYSDGKVVWWSKGEGGFLQEDTPDGDGQIIVKDCQLDKPLSSPAIPNTVSVTGTVSYLLRIALPPQAIIEVQLQDVTYPGAATIIAEDKLTLGDRQAPVPFELKFDSAKTDPQRHYSIRARILVDGQLHFMKDQPYRILDTTGYPAHLDMVLEMENPQSPSKP